MAEIVSLAEAVGRAIHDGDAVAMEGFTHLIPFAAGHEVIRPRRRKIKPIICPFTGERLTAVAAIGPDVAVIHARGA
jgi:acyl CoA:acetate/3-ketoacid CoA transferase alpha subunit